MSQPTIILPRFTADMSWMNISSQQQQQQQLIQQLTSTSPQIQAINNFDLEPQQEDNKFLHDVAQGLKSYSPELIEEGEGGSYFLRNVQGHLLAVFKPSDEDPYSPRNPKLKGRPPLEQRRGILPGEAAIREVAAYLLDHQHFAGVPQTLRVKLNDPYRGQVEGSIQRYQSHDFASWDIGPGAFDKGDVQRIALLDLRLLNTDRHGGNILVRRVECGKKKSNNNNKINSSRTVNKLIPIDHGMCLPDSTINYEELYFEWENWPQAKAPFEPFIRRYVEDLDLWAEVQILRGLGLREECIRLMVVTSTLVKVTVARGFSPSSIAQLMRRVSDEIKLDQLVPDLSGPAVLSSLLFRITSWVESVFPRNTCKPTKTGSSITRAANVDTINSPNNNPYLRSHYPVPVAQRYFRRQNSAPVIVIPK